MEVDHRYMNNILFSVIVASYNNGRYLRELFDSLLGQSYKHWELIFADDCSTDNSVEIIRQFCEKDERVRLYQHERNLGVGAAFRTAAEHAKGEIIGMLGADDALVFDAIEKMLKAHIENLKSSLINSDAYHCDEKLKIVGKYEGFSAIPKGLSLIEHLSVCNFATFKKSAYEKTEKFNPKLKKAVDHDIFLKLDEQGELSYVHEKLYLYRVHSGGISQSENGLRAAQSSILAKKNAYYRRLGTGNSNLSYKSFRRMMIVYYIREAYFYRKSNPAMCNSLLKKSLFEFPIILFERDFWSIFFKK